MEWQGEIEELRNKLGDVTPTSCVGVQKLNQGYPQNSRTFAGKVFDSHHFLMLDAIMVQ